MFIKIQRLATNSGHAQRPHQRPSVFKCIAFVVGLSSLFFLFGFTGVSYAAYCGCGANPCEPDDGCPPSGATNVVCGVKENAVGIEYGCTYTPYTPNWVRTYSCTSNMCQQSSDWCDANKNACRSTCSNNGDCDTTVYYTLTVNTNPSNGGSATGAGRYVSDTTVSADPTPNTGYNFSGWSGGCTSVNGTRCSVKMTGNKAITANFTAAPVVPQKYRLSLTKTGTGVGTVTSSPAGISCGTSCPSTSAEYDSGTTVTLAATAGGANTFEGWGGACSGYGKNSHCRTNMTEAKSVTARFDGQSVTGTLSASPTSGTTDTTFTFTATRTGGTATGTIRYVNPACTGGGTLGGYSGSSDRTFTCKYSSPSGLLSYRGARMTIEQGAATATVSRNVTVTGTTPAGFYIDFVPNPDEGPVGSTFRFTATPRNIPRNTFGQLYSVSYHSHSCGGSTVNGGGNSFTCTYPTAGTKTATIGATATPPGGGIIFDSPQYATGTASVSVTAEEEPEPPPPPPPPPPPASPTATLTGTSPIVRGENSLLRWGSSNATSCSSAQFLTGGARSGSRTVSPVSTTVYSLTCTGLGGTSTSSFTVQVTEPAITDVDVRVANGSPAWVSKGGDTTIEWTIVPEDAGDTASCTVLGVPSGGPFEYTSRRTFDVRSVQEATEYTVSCTNDAPSTGEGSTTVYVLPTFGEF